STKRFSHENPEIQRIYKDFLEKPLSHKAHKYLHTKYQKLEKFRFVDSVVEE
ncbi:MAG: iron hydrogenase small subunit, partial [Kiritimatiellae bacterium]|nr:iron hydrogenase small subunit [Kiritimatiellia bacterium]